VDMKYHLNKYYWFIILYNANNMPNKME